MTTRLHHVVTQLCETCLGASQRMSCYTPGCALAAASSQRIALKRAVVLLGGATYPQATAIELQERAEGKTQWQRMRKALEQGPRTLGELAHHVFGTNTFNNRRRIGATLKQHRDEARSIDGFGTWALIQAEAAE